MIKLDYTILILIGVLISGLSQAFISITYSKYKKINNKKLISGSETARKILKANGLDKIYVVETQGYLTDHYDPRAKVIRLSKDIYNGETLAAASVAAHEVGQAIQDKENYKFMKVRSSLVPLTNIGSKFGYLVIIAGILMNIMGLVYLGLILFGSILLFQLVTLPVEFNASNRAKKNLEKLGILTNSELKSASKVLGAAAFTYVASFITTLIEMMRFVLVANNRRR